MNTLWAICPMVTCTAVPFSPNQPRQHGDEDIGVNRVEDYLEDGVEGHQPGGVLVVALGQLVPDDDHGDAARQPDHDQPDHVVGIGPEEAQEEDGQEEHQHRPDEPVLHQRQPSTRQLRNTRPSSSYLTLASGGYIIRISPMAMGMEVVPTWKRLMKSAVRGQSSPAPPRSPSPGISRA